MLRFEEREKREEERQRKRLEVVAPCVFFSKNVKGYLQGSQLENTKETRSQHLRTRLHSATSVAW